MYLTDLADVLRRAGLDVIEIPGWKTRGRPGTFAPIGVLCHHTAGIADGIKYATWMAITGRSDLPAPLAQLGLNRKGTFYVLAAGRANHAGRCKPIAGLKTYPGRDYGDGNAQLIGIEAMNTGSEGWTSAQYNAYVRGCAALNAAYNFPTSRTLAHRETSTSGKPDPGGISMPEFRRDVAATNPTAPSPEEDDMPYTPDEIKTFAGQGVHGQRIGRSEVTIGVALERLLGADTEQTAQIAALTTAVQTLAMSQGTDPAAIVGVVDAAVRDRLAQIKVSVGTQGATP